MTNVHLIPHIATDLSTLCDPYLSKCVHRCFLLLRRVNLIVLLLCRLLVGAPAAESGQPGIHKGGAVYKCEPDNPNRCDLIPFDTKGESIVEFIFRGSGLSRTRDSNLNCMNPKQYQKPLCS